MQQITLVMPLVLEDAAYAVLALESLWLHLSPASVHELIIVVRECDRMQCMCIFIHSD
jgi:hypothetical protein